MLPTRAQMLLFMAGYPLVGIKIAYFNGVGAPFLLGSLAFVNAWQLYCNRSRAAAIWLCFWTLFDSLYIREWQMLILTPLSFTALRLADWRASQALHPILWLGNLYLLFIIVTRHPF